MIELKDGRKIELNKGLNLEGFTNLTKEHFEKGDMQSAFGYNNNLKTQKTGAEIKALCATKKASYESVKEMIGAKKAFYADYIKKNNFPCTFENENLRYKWNELSSEQQKVCTYYEELCYKSREADRDIKVCNAIIGMLDDKKKYELNSEQYAALINPPDVNVGSAPDTNTKEALKEDVNY